ncbi:hypothetical protein AB6C54_17590, partial [Vibrio splendidus]
YEDKSGLPRKAAMNLFYCLAFLTSTVKVFLLLSTRQNVKLGFPKLLDRRSLYRHLPYQESAAPALRNPDNNTLIP